MTLRIKRCIIVLGRLQFNMYTSTGFPVYTNLLHLSNLVSKQNFNPPVWHLQLQFNLSNKLPNCPLAPRIKPSHDDTSVILCGNLTAYIPNSSPWPTLCKLKQLYYCRNDQNESGILRNYCSCMERKYYALSCFLFMMTPGDSLYLCLALHLNSRLYVLNINYSMRMLNSYLLGLIRGPTFTNRYCLTTNVKLTRPCPEFNDGLSKPFLMRSPPSALLERPLEFDLWKSVLFRCGQW